MQKQCKSWLQDVMTIINNLIRCLILFNVLHFFLVFSPSQNVWISKYPYLLPSIINAKCLGTGPYFKNDIGNFSYHERVYFYFFLRDIFNLLIENVFICHYIKLKYSITHKYMVLILFSYLNKIKSSDTIQNTNTNIVNVSR